MEVTTIHIIGTLRAGAKEEELLGTAKSIIPVSGMPVLAYFLLPGKRRK